jgi:hypothetical protein
MIPHDARRTHVVAATDIAGSRRRLATPRLLRASGPSHRAWGVRCAAGADDHPPRVAAAEHVRMHIVEAEEVSDAMQPVIGRAHAAGAALGDPRRPAMGLEFQGPPLDEADHPRARRAMLVEPADGFFSGRARGTRCSSTPSRRSSCVSCAPLHNRPGHRSARHRGRVGKTRWSGATAQVGLDRIPELLGEIERL